MFIPEREREREREREQGCQFVIFKYQSYNDREKKTETSIPGTNVLPVIRTTRTSTKSYLIES